ncbi:MAG TPA: tRNA adenosine deaminase-associated protein [Acidothermaceae bacterium]|jgi:putative tRNA adenosine deaminase-associated protein|nr:tRNA adenosine deaminase-associated protein [Acidothermaceae bacterium]
MIARTGSRWKGTDADDIDLDNVDDIEQVVDLMRDASVDESPVVMFVEEDDEWFAVVRVDGADEPRIFISDARVVAASDLAMALFGDLASDEALDVSEAIAEDEDVRAEDDESPSVRPVAEPSGATDVLADYGISSQDLLDMCAEEGALPADVITAICERLGCADEIEVYR